MEIKVVAGDITKIKTDAIIVNFFEGVESLDGDIAAVDKALGGAISQLISQGEIKGKLSEITVVHSLDKLPSSRVVVVGLGKQAELTSNKVRGAVAETCRWLRQKGVANIATIAQGAGINGISLKDAAQVVTEGALLGLYSFRKHITREDDKLGEIKQLLIVGSGEAKPSLEEGSEKGRVLAEATNLARDMVNEPANYMTPGHMAEMAMRLAKSYGLEVSVLEQEQMAELGMEALLGVAKGSRQPPKFIILHYKGSDSTETNVALVGKGITFDSGGISIKPSEKLEDMKGDMAGGAAVIAAGRLILADALSYAKKQGAKLMIDAATLTGACRVALGDVCTGAFGNEQELVDKVIAAGTEAGELIWQMPMYDEYKEQNKSDVADIKNVGGRLGGAITAAKFLAEFVDDTPWVHLDIAGTSLGEKERGYLVKGATGVPVRTLVNLVLSLAKD